MAKRRRKASSKKPMSITVRRVGETSGPAPKSYHRAKGPSKALVRATGAVTSARQAASRAAAMVRAEPTRAALGLVGGNIIGKFAGDMIHESGIKDPKGSVANHEATYNLGVAAVASVVAIGASMRKGGSTSSRYAIHLGTNLASHALGEANAINRQNKKPLVVIAPPKTGGWDGSDPFDQLSGDTGAGRRDERLARRQARRNQLAQRVAQGMRAEDPYGAGTEGPELEGYVEGLLEDTAGDVEGLEESLSEVGVLPLMAAAVATPQLIKNISTLLKTMSEQGQAQLKADQAQMPLTSAVLDLEGVDTEGMDTGAKKDKAKELRKEKKRLERALRAKQRRDKRAAKAAKKEAPLVRDIAELKRQLEPAKPMVIRTLQPVEESEETLIVIPSDEELQEVSEGRPLRIRY